MSAVTFARRGKMIMASGLPVDAGIRTLSRRQFLGTVGAVAGGIGLAACGSSSPTSSTPGSTTSPAGAPKKGGTLMAALSGGDSTDTLDAQNPYNNTDFARVRQLYNSLVEYDANVVPQLVLAESITPNTTATLWTIRLKSGITFHNGKPLTADDVIFSLQRIVNPKFPLPGAVGLTLVDVKGLKKLDDLTVQVPCSAPLSTFVELLGAYYYNIVPVGYDPKSPVGTGPFKYVSFTPAVSSTFTRNDNYFENGLPYLDKVVISDFADETSQLNALESGSANVIDLLSAASVAGAKQAGKEVLIASGGGWTPFTMRVDQAPFSDVRVRQAMRLIVDRKQMLDIIFLGHGTIGNDLFAIWDSEYDQSLPQREQDIDQAKFLLKQAGHESLSVQLVTTPLAQGTVQAATVLAQQASAAGVTINLKSITGTAFFNDYLKWTFAQDYWYYNPYYPQVAQATLGTAPFNECHFSNSNYNKLFNEGLATLDATKRADIAHEMQQIDYTEGGYIIPYFPPVIDAYATQVQGLVPSKTGLPLGGFNFKELWLS